MDLSLIVNWAAFAGALVLLWLPPSLLMSGPVKRHLSHQRGASDFNLLRGLLAWQNWLDLGRSYAGCYLLFGYALEAAEGQELKLFGWRAGILLIALLLQTVRRHRGRTYFLGPIFFVWGITIFLVGPVIAFYGIAAGALVASVAGNLEWKLPVMAVVVAVAGYLLREPLLNLALSCVLIVFPLVATFCGRGHMVLLMREPEKHGREG